jgi:hypothetical protein
LIPFDTMRFRRYNSLIRVNPFILATINKEWGGEMIQINKITLCWTDSAGERSGERFPPSWAARHSPDVDLDGEILAWIASHVPSHKRLKTPH